MLPDDKERCPGKVEEGQMVGLCEDCARRQWRKGSMHPVGSPTVRWTIRYGRRCDKRIPVQAEAVVA